jgi:hypothetical protein
MGETSFRGDLVFLVERCEWSETSGLLDVLLMVALSFTIISKYTPCIVATRNSAGYVVILTTCATWRIVATRNSARPIVFESASKPISGL